MAIYKTITGSSSHPAEDGQQCAGGECLVTVKGRRAFKPRTAAIAQKPGHLWHNWVTPGGVGGLSLGGCGCVQQGVKWRGHRPPTLARSVCWRSFFRCSLARLGAAAAAEPAPQRAAAIPTVGPELLAATALSPTLGLRTAASAAIRPTCTCETRSKRGEKSRNLLFSWLVWTITAAKEGLPGQLSSSSE